MIKFAIKAGLAFGAGYYLAEQGIWRESSESIKTYQKMCETVTPYWQDVEKQLPFKIPTMPNTEKVSYVIKDYWNQAVMTSFDYLCELPEHASSWTQSGIKLISGNKELSKMFSSNISPPATMEAKTGQSKEKS